jgi:hypothetical protein
MVRVLASSTQRARRAGSLFGTRETPILMSWRKSLLRVLPQERAIWDWSKTGAWRILNAHSPRKKIAFLNL